MTCAMRQPLRRLWPLVLAGGSCAATAGPLPFEDGRYLSDPGLCSLTEKQLVERVGDDVYEMLIDIAGPTVNAGFEAYCDVQEVSMSGSAVEFLASCDSEGETYDVGFSFTFISPTSFRVDDQVYVLCE